MAWPIPSTRRPCDAFTSILPGQPPRVEASYRTPAGPNSSGGNPRAIDASRVIYAYEGKPALMLIHLIEVGDGAPTDAFAGAEVLGGDHQRLKLGGRTFHFSDGPTFAVSREE